MIVLLRQKHFLRALDGNRNSLVAHIELVDLLLFKSRTASAALV